VSVGERMNVDEAKGEDCDVSEQTVRGRDCVTIGHGENREE